MMYYRVKDNADGHWIFINTRKNGIRLVKHELFTGLELEKYGVPEEYVDEVLVNRSDIFAMPHAPRFASKGFKEWYKVDCWIRTPAIYHYCYNVYAIDEREAIKQVKTYWKKQKVEIKNVTRTDLKNGGC